MERADVNQLYSKTLIDYKGSLMYVQRVSEDGKSLLVFDLHTQNEKNVAFNKTFIIPPPGRIGYVNVKGAVVYISRKAYRQYKIGLCLDNIYVKNFYTEPYRKDPDKFYETINAVDRVHWLVGKELVDAVAGKYPVLIDAYAQAVKLSGIVAFDKQFAVDFKKKVWYKGRDVYVGTYSPETNTVTFNAGMEHLSAHLENNYGESLKRIKCR